MNGVVYTPMSAYQTYKDGLLNDEIITILDNWEKVGKIIERVTGQEKYLDNLPYFAVCENCGKLYTTFAHDYNSQTHTVQYEVRGMEVKGRWQEGCGHKGESDVLGGNGKLPWKVEFGARWHALDIRFEAYGKDIADSVYSRYTRLQLIVSYDSSNRVQFQQPFKITGGWLRAHGHKHAGHGQQRFFFGLDVLQFYFFNGFVAEDFQYHRVPGYFYLGVRLDPFLHNPGSPQLIAAMYKDNLFSELGKF